MPPWQHKREPESPSSLAPKERVWRVLNLQPVDRVPCVDVYFMPETLKRWEKEGLPSGTPISEFFDLDIVCLPVDCSLGRREKVLDETDEYRIVVDPDGVTRKHWKVYTAAPQELDFPVKQPRDWRETRPLLKAHEERLPENFEVQIARARERQRFIALSLLEPCTLARRLAGSHQWVELLQTQNPLLDEILEVGVKIIVETVDIAFKRVAYSKITHQPFDGIWLYAELAYTYAAFMSDREYRSVVLPYHRQLSLELKRHGLAVLLYTTGNALAFLKTVHKSGFNAILPLESFSRNDLATYKHSYGNKIALGGNISVDKLMESEEAADREVREKVAVGMGENFSGYLFCMDRVVPPPLSLDRYIKVLHTARSIS